MVIIKPDLNIQQKPDLTVKIGKMALKNPIITASGTFGYADEFEGYVDLEKIGAIVTKGITLKPRKGNAQPRLKEYKSGLINSIGLENIGINAFIEKKVPLLYEKNIPFIVNIAGFAIEEYLELARICEVNKIEAIEVNVSCPNVKAGCLEFGTDGDILYKLISRIKEHYTGTVIVKLTPNVTDPAILATKAQQAGADAISAINTVRALNVNVQFKDGKFDVQKMKGGYSGPSIKPIALNYINTISQCVDIPIIGMGGITCFADMLEFFAVGSSAIQIGTANFTYPGIADHLRQELERFVIQNGFSSLNELLEGVRNVSNS